MGLGVPVCAPLLDLATRPGSRHHTISFNLATGAGAARPWPLDADDRGLMVEMGGPPRRHTWSFQGIRRSACHSNRSATDFVPIVILAAVSW